MINLQIVRESEARKAFGLPRSTFRLRIKQGLIPPPISIGSPKNSGAVKDGGRATGWLRHELDAVIASMAAGSPIQELESLVQALVSRRDEARQKILASIGLNSAD